jgi:drug/metabolite transporter (DMT)-like permease
VAGHASPIAKGVGLAGLAAFLFGVTAPLLQRASADVGTLTAGALLYLGAATAAGAGAIARGRGADLRPPRDRRLWLRAGAVAALGAVAAPALLVSGLRRTDAATGSLLLTLEAPLTLILARAFFGERLGPRVVVAGAATTLGAALLVLHPMAKAVTGAVAGTGAGGTATGNTPLGTLLVLLATLCWALDNLVSRALAELDPVRVVTWKGAIGGLLSMALAVLAREPLPSPIRLAALLGIGGLGYGVSLQLYLRAQTLVGTARTASVFATAPFVGAAVAIALGWARLQWSLLAGGALMVGGVILHLLERHGHPHAHEAQVHDHLHTHDDGHHDHPHDEAPTGPHSHVHAHEALVHTHEHGEDLHHRHPH